MAKSRMETAVELNMIINHWSSADTTPAQIADIIWTMSMDPEAWAEFASAVTRERASYLAERKLSQ